MPVRDTIHSSLVSNIPSRSVLVRTRSGVYAPSAVIPMGIGDPPTDTVAFLDQTVNELSVSSGHTADTRKGHGRTPYRDLHTARHEANGTPRELRPC
ncbi:hypothetical protein GCM10008939_28700 [Deinococcus aquiradiocola]|uniref:Uncharacterized protein n=1 Tax=Deinococcus aquiradiocola TaxID=393059 RepID=A0A917PKQ1_9DEIO|nr:hypothetical protein GCM10008939_28700 [Deinococcus aquiradiocola]